MDLGIKIKMILFNLSALNIHNFGAHSEEFNPMMKRKTKAALFASILLLSLTPVLAQTVNLIRVPLIRQSTDYTCGVAALQALLAYYGQDVREDLLSKALHAQHKSGTRYKNIANYAQQHGLSVKIWKEMSVDELRQSLKAGHPVLCLIQAWPDKKTDFALDWDDGHYVVAVGFDDQKFVFMDPSTAGHYTYIPVEEFFQRWHDLDGKEKLNHFGMSIWKEGGSYDPDKLERLN
jgi:predicted double-glycine peptidase